MVSGVEDSRWSPEDRSQRADVGERELLAERWDGENLL